MLGLEDLPVKLLQRLELNRAELNQADDRPACAGAGDAYPFDYQDRGKEVPETIQRSAFQFCASCPVRQQCSESADLRRDEGLRGGEYRYWAWQKSSHKRVYQKVNLIP